MNITINPDQEATAAMQAKVNAYNRVMSPSEQREKLKQVVLAYGRAMATGDELLVKLAGEEAMRRIAEAVPDKANIDDVS
jgi:hypothetical protein